MLRSMHAVFIETEYIKIIIITLKSFKLFAFNRYQSLFHVLYHIAHEEAISACEAISSSQHTDLRIQINDTFIHDLF